MGRWKEGRKDFLLRKKIKITKGNLFIIDGDDVLTTFIAIGSNIPVKKVKYSGEFNQESMMTYNKAHMNDMSPAAGSIGATW